MWPRPDIQQLRSKLGMTDFQFAKRLGVSTETVAMWEAGSSTVPQDCEKKLFDLQRYADRLADLHRLRALQDQRAADKQRSGYIIANLPDGGFVAVKK